MTTRRDELAANLADTEARIAAAVPPPDATGSELTLVVVTKTFPASDVVEPRRAGRPGRGENRHQEAAPKFAQAYAEGPGLSGI